MRFKTIGILLTLTLSSAICRAETLVHDFQEMPSPGTIVYTEKNTIGTTAELTYTCSDGASFGSACYGGTRICINFREKYDQVILSPIEHLAGITIDYFQENTSHDNFEICLSRDGSTWTKPIAQDVNNKGRTVVTFVPGSYYVRIRNRYAKKAAIWQMTYTFGDCNCFLYFPE